MITEAATTGENEFLSLGQAAKALPGKRHVSTLHRWRMRGVRGVHLQTCLIGGRRFTTNKWLNEFLTATNEQESGVRPTTVPQSSKSREAAIRTAEQELDAAGF